MLISNARRDQLAAYIPELRGKASEVVRIRNHPTLDRSEQRIGMTLSDRSGQCVLESSIHCEADPSCEFRFESFACCVRNIAQWDAKCDKAKCSKLDLPS